MKNKIILLLVLLIPSICFGRSVSISVINIMDTDEQHIIIKDSQTGKESIFKLKIQNNLISISENIDEFKKLREQLYLLFTSKSFDFANDSKSFGFWMTETSIVDNAVYADWQITHHSSESKGKFTIMNLFLYKQDK
jgi:hypothetical protein